MLISVDISEKSFGDKVLYTDLQLAIEKNEKVGLIGRNGTGKSTLFNMITGTDTDFQGEISVKRGTIIASSRQEHHGHEHKTVMEYIQGDLPEYAKLAHVLDTYPETMGEDMKKMHIYSEALERFSQLGYFQVEDELGQMFEAYQLDPAKLHGKVSELSGGQKRMVELIKVQRSRADIALIDEPTNHMDYVAKKAFAKWLGSVQESVLVITHDRDVLQTVDRIIEIRDGRAFAFKGNYDQFLKTNSGQITAQVNEYDLTQKRIRNLTDDVIRFRRLKERSRDPGTIKRFKSQEMQASAELNRLSKTEKPSFWIDQESVTDLSTKMGAAYEKYKAKNIKLHTGSVANIPDHVLVQGVKLSLGYNEPLFEDLTFSVSSGERLRLHGRNGAGKSTLINAIMAKSTGEQAPAKQYSGHLIIDNHLQIGLYEQEINPKYLELTLHDAIEQMLADKGLPVNDQKVKQLLGDYLFNPAADGSVAVERLSGGQKARFQLMRMLASNPELLILDEPTNHLDLPSIEELENTLLEFKGAIIYVSHDSYFADKFAGGTLEIGS
ncbi:MAG: ATPase component of transporter with duplicated ATPase protein [Candidatus Saccharibacteria bacterium]|nr:ATPase component of transporter with duplicated ATPase protein [Candidatus Saccharibacteria bacterium]